MAKKIHCLEMAKNNLGEETYDELKKMVGYYEPEDPQADKTQWIVTMMDESFFTCNTQAQAQIISSLEEIKAILVQNRLDTEQAQELSKKFIRGMSANPLKDPLELLGSFFDSEVEGG